MMALQYSGLYIGTKKCWEVCASVCKLVRRASHTFTPHASLGNVFLIPISPMLTPLDMFCQVQNYAIISPSYHWKLHVRILT